MYIYHYPPEIPGRLKKKTFPRFLGFASTNSTKLIGTNHFTKLFSKKSDGATNSLFNILQFFIVSIIHLRFGLLIYRIRNRAFDASKISQKSAL